MVPLADPHQQSLREREVTDIQLIEIPQHRIT
jgi:hypothetical protein